MTNENISMENRQKAIARADELKGRIDDYREALKTMPTGFKHWPRIEETQKRIKNFFKASDKDWDSWR